MTVDRRNVLKLGSAMAVGSVLPGALGANTGATASEIRSSFKKTQENLRAILAVRGFSETPVLSVVSGQEGYNGGLRHDSDLDRLENGQFVIQPCARMEDVQERQRSDVLPLFHECAVKQPGSVSRDDNARMGLDLLIRDFGLDPSRLGFVSVPHSEVLQAVLSEYGFAHDEDVYLRNPGEALAARDSSGYFFQDPASPEYMVTLGVYYRLSQDGSNAINSYPPSSNWTEIAEIVFDGSPVPVLSIGVERLNLAATGHFPTWEDRLGDLFDQVEAAQPDLQAPGVRAFR